MPAGAVTALGDVSIRVDAMDYVAITGPSGCGKSTLLHILGCVDQPSTGYLVFEGRDVRTLTDSELSRIRLTTHARTGTRRLQTVHPRHPGLGRPRNIRANGRAATGWHLVCHLQIGQKARSHPPVFGIVMRSISKPRPDPMPEWRPLPSPEDSGMPERIPPWLRIDAEAVRSVADGNTSQQPAVLRRDRIDDRVVAASQPEHLAVS